NIKLATGTYSAHIIMTNKVLVFYGVGATINAQGTNAVFEVDDGAHLRIAGATLSAATGVGVIRCEGAAAASHILELFRVTLNNTSTTLLANRCMVTVTESVLHSTSTVDYQIIIVGPSVASFERSRFVGNTGAAGLAGLANATININNSVFTK